jgi:hypothetical protein
MTAFSLAGASRSFFHDYYPQIFGPFRFPNVDPLAAFL